MSADHGVHPGSVMLAGAEIREHTLPNGLRVILAERHDDPVVATLMLYRVGSRNELEEEAGVSHFLEHMMFKGSARYEKGEVDLRTAELGGNNNAFTTPDHTAYYFEFTADRWDVALEIEADRMRGLSLDPVEFEAEKQVVLSELAMGEDDPWRNLSQQVSEILFARHPYRRPVIGYAESLARMTPDDMRSYHRRYYNPANATLVISGDITPDDALARIAEHFGSIEAGTRFEDVAPYRPPLAEPRGERRVTTYWDDESRRLVIGWPTVPVGSREDDALDLISVLLTTGRLSRLHRRLVLDEGLAVNVSTSNDTRVDSGAFWLYAECAAGVTPQALEAVIDEELKLLATSWASADELKRARRILEASDAYELESALDLAEDLGELAIDADWRLVLNSKERYAAIRPKYLMEVAVRLLSFERRVVGWSLPELERLMR
ncbi:MAG: insulinase family protein [Planctomycetes bacterium]|nr:insulinase family protein [Planctomycetota bacterium]MCB9902977.1 insulinase family protein [Planctomycetota bacterium]